MVVLVRQFFLFFSHAVSMFGLLSPKGCIALLCFNLPFSVLHPTFLIDSSPRPVLSRKCCRPRTKNPNPINIFLYLWKGSLAAYDE